MTQKTVLFDAQGKPHKAEGWFSWRHPKRDAHDEATARYLADHGPEARRKKAAERRTDAQRWACGHVSSSANHPCGGAR